MVRAKLIFLLVLSIYVKINAVPPEACFAKFNWNDCGRSPQRVLYYWKPGSRCEIGLWRGCLPNLNMFQDEYECVATCIFTARARAEDYHNLLEEDVENKTDLSVETNNTEITNNTETTIDANATESEVTTVSDANVTEVSPADNATVTEGENTTDANVGNDTMIDNKGNETTADNTTDTNSTARR